MDFVHATGSKLATALGMTDSETSDAVYITVSVVLVLFGGLMSGLTLGLMSLDTVQLEILKRTGSPVEKERAARIMPVLTNPHMLLVTLLLCNSAAMEALPIFIDRLLTPVAAILLSVTAVLIVGEIIPQAVCSRYGLAVGAASASIVRVLMFLCWPIAKPISLILDSVLGHGKTALFRRRDLKALVEVHAAERGGNLSRDEIHVIQHALDMTSKTGLCPGAMTPLDKVFMLSAEDHLDEEMLESIVNAEHTRVPVYEGERTRIIGVLLTRDLATVRPSLKRQVSELRMRSIPHVPACTPLYDVLRIMQNMRCHMVVVTHCPMHSQQSVPNGGSPESPMMLPGFDRNSLSQMEGGWPDDSIGRASDGGALCSGHASLHVQPRTESKVDHLIDAVTSDAFGDELPLGIISLDDIMMQLLPPRSALGAPLPHLNGSADKWRIVPRVGTGQELKQPLMWATPAEMT